MIPWLGVLNLNVSYSITLTENVVFQPVCTDGPQTTSEPTAVIDATDPFYASTSPQLYAMGCMTVISYVLVIILLITPRTFYVGGLGGGGGNFLSQHGMIGSSRNGPSAVGVGGRPWLQKVAVLLVAISLTIASVDSFRVAENQYDYGYMDAVALTKEVLDGMEIRIVKVISSTFLWLAQVQTLIRLFPRHKEKVMIKWAGFALIVLDTIFAILDNFVIQNSTVQPRFFDDAISVLSYLFELALNLLYAAWVIFYALSKHRFAFFHPKMRNICLVALLSLAAIFIPVVFFVMDISQPNVEGWGEYIRWVGSAAASVVVWEWVERIEVLERDERKDGILGRELFDGDEMLEVTPSEEIDWPRQPGGGHDGVGISSGWAGVRTSIHRPLRARVGFHRANPARRDLRANAGRDREIQESTSRGNHPSLPSAVVTPISRGNTTSAASTTYYVHYHPIVTPSPILPISTSDILDEGEKDVAPVHSHAVRNSKDSSHPDTTEDFHKPSVPQESRWFFLPDLFKRKRASPPQEVATAQTLDANQQELGENLEEDNESRNLTSRMQTLIFRNRNRRHSMSNDGGNHAPLPVTVIPPRDRAQKTWSPEQSDRSMPPANGSSQLDSFNQPNLPVGVSLQQIQQSGPLAVLSADRQGRIEAESYLHYDPETAALVEVRYGNHEFDNHGSQNVSSPGGSSSGNAMPVLSEEDYRPVHPPPVNERSAGDSEARDV